MGPARHHSFASLSVAYLAHARLAARSYVSFRANSILLMLAVLLREGVNVGAVALLFSRFPRLNGWTLPDLFFLYSFLFLSYSIVTLLFAGIRDFDVEVQEGLCDRYLLRPLGVFLQVVGSKSDFVAAVGHGALGLALFVASASRVDVEWTAGKVAFAAASVAAGVLIQAAIFVVSASLSFWTIKATNLRNLLFFGTRRFAAYPISIYPAAIKILTIYVVPFAMVNYFPAQYLLRRSDGFDLPPFAYWAPFACAAFTFTAALGIWRLGVRHYASAGN